MEKENTAHASSVASKNTSARIAHTKRVVDKVVANNNNNNSVNNLVEAIPWHRKVYGLSRRGPGGQSPRPRVKLNAFVAEERVMQRRTAHPNQESMK